MQERSRHGFTLIELLVVIVIILILASILFPVFVSARENARTVRCAANLKNLAVAMTLYFNDWDKTPDEWWSGGPSGGSDRKHWMFCFMPYIGQALRKDTMYGSSNADKNDFDNIFNCPSAPWIKGTWQTAFSNRTIGFAISMNETGWSQSGTPCAAWGLKPKQVRRPADFIYAADGMGFYEFGIGYGNGGVVQNNLGLTGSSGGRRAFVGGGGGWTSVHPPDNNNNIPLYTPSIYNPRNGGSQSKVYNIRVSHNFGANCLFWDGHVRCMRMTKCYNWGLLNYTTQ